MRNVLKNSSLVVVCVAAVSAVALGQQGGLNQ